ncbi:nucleotidyltransferase domain-containing protein [Tissierella sp.]|uniref:nucleotidyltransferase domain-containing protein n=1 Tax=Tissierella sp. TaxID=41274 RepID=UPI0030342F71
MHDKIITYLNDKYKPHTIMVYGSFADGSNNTHSDYDALVISDTIVEQHDGHIIDNIELDVFIYPTTTIEGLLDFSQFTKLYDSKIIKDERKIGFHLKERVIKYVEDNSIQSYDKKKHLYGWCKKMLNRTQRGDAEGYYRWHWLITDSLEVYCILRNKFYFGPKKTILQIEKIDKKGYELFLSAVTKLDYENLKKWIYYVIGEFDE